MQLLDVTLLKPEELANLPEPIQKHYTALLHRLVTGTQQRRLDQLFPDENIVYPDGSIIYARRFYAKHLEFFKAGATYRERAAIMANRVGKTVSGAYETTAHLTGDYPHWWEGRRFDHAVKAWACGKKNETTRDIVQAELLGPVAFEGGRKRLAGTGMIPGELIGRVTWKRGVEDLVDTVQVRHKSGGWSKLSLKSYEQGRGSFEGTAQHVIWLDEECPMDIYGECLIRTATTKGIIMLTFTPLEGLSETVLQFQPAGDKAKLGSWAA